MDCRVEEEEDEEKSVDFHENPISVYPVKVYNKYVMHDYSNPNWHYIYKINLYTYPAVSMILCNQIPIKPLNFHFFSCLRQ